MIRAFKGFQKDMTCRGFQYEDGKEYETEKAECCESGFHACEYPLDVFGYYNPADSVFHEVELDGDIDRNGGGDTKLAATKIKIGVRLSIARMVEAALDFTYKHVKKEAGASEPHGHAGATGYRGASSATGYRGASSATGDCGASSATGDYGASSATGYRGASSATGDCGASSATGDCGASSATGDYGASSATGDCGASSATGYRGASSADDPTGVAVAWGHEAKAKGCKGAHLVLSDWRYIGERYSDGTPCELWKKELWELAGAVMVVVDGEKIKENTYYRCEGGNVVEVPGGND